MADWLMKSVASLSSWAQQVEAGAKGTFWNGVRNHQAKQCLMAMKKGETAFFYHSNEERAVVGIVEIVKTFYPDPTDESSKFGMVDVRAKKPFKTPVLLAAIKAEASLAKMVLVNNSRLSVQPVSDDEWRIVCAMGGL